MPGFPVSFLSRAPRSSRRPGLRRAADIAAIALAFSIVAVLALPPRGAAPPTQPTLASLRR